MTTQYTPTLKLALPVTGELSGTWGDTVNDNITSMVEQAIAGLSTINTWATNSHTLTTANGTTSESRCAMLVAATGGGAPTAAAEIICPAAAKLYVLQNNTAFAVTLKTAAGTGVSVPVSQTAFLFCDGTNVNACVTTIVNGSITGNLTVGGNLTVDGNTTLGNATSDLITATGRFNTDLLPSTDNTRDLGSAANAWKDLFIDGTATMALVAISGGTINGVSIGVTTAATFIAVDNLSLDGNTLASTNTNGNVVIAPNGTGDVQLDADTVRVGDSAAAATLTSNGAGALTVTTGGAADLTLSTNSGANSGTVVIANGVDGNITVTPNGTGDVILSADRTQIGDLNTDALLTTSGTGNLNLSTNNGTNSGTIQIAQGVNGAITLTPNGTGVVSVPTLGVTGGTANGVAYLDGFQVLTTGSALTFDGTTLATTNDAAIQSVTVGLGAGAVAGNTVVGYSALASNTTGGSNTAIGFNALSLNTLPQWETAVGAEALKKSQGSSNTAVGAFALQNTTTANDNTVVGAFALSQNITGANNVVVGANALANHTAGSGNVAVGSYALLAQTAGGNNTIVGFFAGSGLTSGSRNTFVGTYDGTDGSGSLITSGSANTILGGFNGNRGGVDIRTASNYVVLSDGDGNPRGVFNDIGNFSVAAGAAIVGSRINPRVSTTASTATLTPDISVFDQYNLTTQAVGLTVAAPDGSPEDGNKLILRISDDGTSRAITWNGTYTVIGTTLPTATVAGKTTYVGCIYNSNQVRWDVVAVTTQA